MKHVTLLLVVAIVVGWLNLSRMVGAHERETSAGQFGVWSTVATTCSVRPGDEALARFKDSKVKFKGSATGTICLNYSAIEPDDWVGLGGAEVRVRFRDNGAAARVVLRLHVVNVFSNDEDVVEFFDSNDYSPIPDVRTKIASICLAAYPDSASHVFWVEAVLTRTSSSGKAELHWIHAAEDVCG